MIYTQDGIILIISLLCVNNAGLVYDDIIFVMITLRIIVYPILQFLHLYVLIFITGPVAQWESPEVSFREGELGQVCFTRSASSVRPYVIQVGVRAKGFRPATRGSM